MLYLIYYFNYGIIINRLAVLQQVFTLLTTEVRPGIELVIEMMYLRRERMDIHLHKHVHILNFAGMINFTLQQFCYVFFTEFNLCCASVVMCFLLCTHMNLEYI